MFPIWYENEVFSFTEYESSNFNQYIEYRRRTIRIPLAQATRSISSRFESNKNSI